MKKERANRQKIKIYLIQEKTIYKSQLKEYREVSRVGKKNRKVYVKRKSKTEKEVQDKLVISGNKTRLSIAINFPLDNKYYGALAQLWTKNPNENKKNALISKLLKFLEDFLNYDSSDFWFSFDARLGIGEQEVSDNINEGFYILQIEDNNGNIVKKDTGYL